MGATATSALFELSDAGLNETWKVHDAVGNSVVPVHWSLITSKDEVSPPVFVIVLTDKRPFFAFLILKVWAGGLGVFTIVSPNPSYEISAISVVPSTRNTAISGTGLNIYDLPDTAPALL